MNWRTATRVLQVVFGVLYPFAVYAAFRLAEPQRAALILLGLSGCIFVSSILAGSGVRAWGLPAVMTAVVGISALPGASRLLLSMPVVTNLGLLVVFGVSHLRGTPAVERFARLSDPQLSEARVHYCARLNLVWCAFFGLNATLCALFALYAPVEWWALYTGIIAYAAAGMLAGGEYLFRLWYFRTPRAC